MFKDIYFKSLLKNEKKAESGDLCDDLMWNEDSSVNEKEEEDEKSMNTSVTCTTKIYIKIIRSNLFKLGVIVMFVYSSLFAT